MNPEYNAILLDAMTRRALAAEAAYTTLLAWTREFLAADDAVYASMHQRGRAPDHSARCMRRLEARTELRRLASLSPKTDAVKAMTEAKYTFRDLKTALEMDPADTRGLPKVK